MSFNQGENGGVNNLNNLLGRDLSSGSAPPQAPLNQSVPQDVQMESSTVLEGAALGTGAIPPGPGTAPPVSMDVDPDRPALGPEENPSRSAADVKEKKKKRGKSISGAERKRRQAAKAKLLQDQALQSDLPPLQTQTQDASGSTSKRTRAQRSAELDVGGDKRRRTGSADQEEMQQRPSFAMAAATEDFRVILSCGPPLTDNITELDSRQFQAELSRLMLQMPQDAQMPRFRSFTLRNGSLCVYCEDAHSKDWLTGVVREKLVECIRDLRILDALPKLQIALFHYPSTLNPEDALAFLQRQNEGLRTDLWKTQGEPRQDDGTATLNVFVDPTSIDALRKVGFHPFCGASRAYIRIITKNKARGPPGQDAPKGASRPAQKTPKGDESGSHPFGRGNKGAGDKPPPGGTRKPLTKQRHISSTSTSTPTTPSATVTSQSLAPAVVTPSTSDSVTVPSTQIAPPPVPGSETLTASDDEWIDRELAEQTQERGQDLMELEETGS